ncbi:MAG: ferredoxin--NADP reductase [Candidatus Nanoarchaeia archaeon]
MAVPIYDTKISKITEETPNTKTYTIDMPDFSFKAGQFVMLIFDLDEETARRAYSISSSPLDKGSIDLTIKLEPNGKGGSKKIHTFKEGDQVQVQGPFGMFVMEDDVKHAVMLAAGSGIAPFRSMWRYRVAKNLGTTDVLFCATTKERLIFYDDMKKLTEENESFNAYFSVTREEPKDWPYGTCRFTIEHIKEHSSNYEDSTFYLCGSPQFCEGMRNLLLDNGVEKERVKMEKYW